VLVNSKILIVAGVSPDRVLYRRAFTHAGYEVVVASNGREAIDILAKEKHHDVELVISEVSLGYMCGLELLERLRNRPEKLPVILLSPRPLPGTLQFQPDGFLKMPFPLEHLIWAAKDLLPLPPPEFYRVDSMYV
jgi:CheY-like chemotaxis protein